jgi:hypothetical protein
MVHCLFGKASLSARAIERFYLFGFGFFESFMYSDVPTCMLILCLGLGAPNVTSFASCSAHVRELGRGPW